MSTPNKLYVVVLDSLTPAQKAVQGMHALAELLLCTATRSTKGVQDWHCHHKTLVVLQTNAENLRALASTPGAASFIEPDLHDTLTAVALDPCQARKPLKTLPKALF